MELHFWAAFTLEEAVSAHLAGDHRRAKALLRAADHAEFRPFLKSLWGPYTEFNSPIDGRRVSASVSIDVEERSKARMPDKALLNRLIDRDGYRCRYCTIPLIPKDVRGAISAAYPKEVPWGRKEIEQHAGLQALWMQFDHLVPHSRGGENAMENLVICCAGCNFGKSNYLLEELGLANPFDRAPIKSSWNGLTQVLEKTPNK